MILTKEEILLILKKLDEETVIEPSKTFPFRVSREKSFGYSDDKKVNALQAKLSILLEITTRPD